MLNKTIAAFEPLAVVPRRSEQPVKLALVFTSATRVPKQPTWKGRIAADFVRANPRLRGEADLDQFVVADRIDVSGGAHAAAPVALSPPPSCSVGMKKSASFQAKLREMA